jgi:hypothetical protein
VALDTLDNWHIIVTAGFDVHRHIVKGPCARQNSPDDDSVTFGRRKEINGVVDACGDADLAGSLALI